MKLLRRYLFNNFSLKLISLASAVLLWSAIAHEPMVEVAHSVPIEFEHVPDDVTLSSPSLPDAQVWIRGPQRLVRDVKTQDLHLTIDVANLKNNLLGEHHFELHPSQIHAPYGVEIVQVAPAEVRLSFTRR